MRDAVDLQWYLTCKTCDHCSRRSASDNWIRNAEATASRLKITLQQAHFVTEAVDYNQIAHDNDPDKALKAFRLAVKRRMLNSKG